MLNWSSEGIGLITICFAIVLSILFKSKQFGLFDPLTFFIITRISPAFGALILMISLESLFSFFYIITLISVIIFTSTLLFVSPRIRPRKVVMSQSDVDRIARLAILLLIVKLALILISSGPLPVFGERGSDSFIDFESDNKLITSFVFAIGSTELILLSFVVPLINTRKRILVAVLIVISCIFHLFAGKKSSVLQIFYALALGEYLRVAYTSNNAPFFLKRVVSISIIVVSLSWAGFIYSQTVSDYDVQVDFVNVILSIPDIIFFQWAYPIFIFASGELSNFIQNYEVNKIIYFFHTALSPLGFPAFAASIGPSIHEYQTGNLSGNGINPTYIIEGYVIFGILLPLYSFIIAFIVAKIRKKINSLEKPGVSVVMSALLLQSIYAIPVDSLFFMKIIIALVLLSPILYLLIRKIGDE